MTDTTETTIETGYRSKVDVFKDIDGNVHAASCYGEIMLVLSPSEGIENMYSGSIKVDNELMSLISEGLIPDTVFDDWIVCMDRLKEQILEEKQDRFKGNIIPFKPRNKS